MRARALTKYAVRFAGAAGAIAAATFLISIGSGDAAAQSSCSAVNGQRVQQIHGNSACAATAGGRSRAQADDVSPGGTAVSVSDNGGNATSRNMQPGSTALAGANHRGTAYSVTTGPGAMSVAQADKGATALALGGWGGQAFSSQKGTACIGGFAMAYESSTGKMCMRSGSVYFQN